jgi:KDO2-lipid IV(A) lauroyltransferase
MHPKLGYFNYITPRYWPLWFGLALLRMSVFLPYAAMKFLSRGVAHLIYILLPGRKRVAEINIRLCFPELSESKVQAMVRETINSTAMIFFEISLAWWASNKRLKAMVSFEGVENIEAARKNNRGIILLGGHYTTLEISGRLLTYYMPDFHPVYKAARNKLFNTIMVNSREKAINPLLENRNMRKIISTLKKGGSIWYAPDQDFGPENSVFAPFMGVQTSTLLATSRLAKLSGAAVVPFYSARLNNGKYIIRFGKSFENFPSGDDIKDASKINSAIEEHVREYPEQYLWLHKRFKTRPQGEPNIYEKINTA